MHFSTHRAAGADSGPLPLHQRLSLTLSDRNPVDRHLAAHRPGNVLQAAVFTAGESMHAGGSIPPPFPKCEYKYIADKTLQGRNN
jgi:hypothetical protein